MLLGLLLTVGLLVLPAMVVALAMHRQAGDGSDQLATADKSRVALAVLIAAVALAVLIAAVALAIVAFRWISGYGLQQSAPLFAGILALLAIVAVFSPTPRSATGVAGKAGIASGAEPRTIACRSTTP